MAANPTAKTSQGISTSRLAAVIVTDPVWFRLACPMAPCRHVRQVKATW